MFQRFEYVHEYPVQAMHVEKMLHALNFYTVMCTFHVSLFMPSAPFFCFFYSDSEGDLLANALVIRSWPVSGNRTD